MTKGRTMRKISKTTAIEHIKHFIKQASLEDLAAMFSLTDPDESVVVIEKDKESGEYFYGSACR
jgi:hypothetical protein